MAKFDTQIVLPHSRETVFNFLIRPQNLLQMFPPDAGLHVVSVPDILQCGSRLEFKASAFGLNLKIIHEITELVTPERLVERQVEGLFKHWVHKHIVEQDAAGNVIAIDRVEFEPPWRYAGICGDKRKILENLEVVFHRRNEEMLKLLSSQA